MITLRHPLLPWLAPLGAAATVASAQGLALGAPACTATVTTLLALLVAWIAWQDVRSFTISDAALAAIALLAIAVRLGVAQRVGTSLTAGTAALLLDAALPGGTLLLFREVYYRRTGIDGLGLGDVKLAAVGGMLLGVEVFAWALLAASLGALGVVGLRRIAGTAMTGSAKLPFGAALAPAMLVAFILEQLVLLEPAAA